MEMYLKGILFLTLFGMVHGARADAGQSKGAACREIVPFGRMAIVIQKSYRPAEHVITYSGPSLLFTDSLGEALMVSIVTGDEVNLMLGNSVAAEARFEASVSCRRDGMDNEICRFLGKGFHVRRQGEEGGSYYLYSTEAESGARSQVAIALDYSRTAIWVASSSTADSFSLEYYRNRGECARGSQNLGDRFCSFVNLFGLDWRSNPGEFRVLARSLGFSDSTPVFRPDGLNDL